MKPFLSEDFLLDTKTAIELYHDVAKRQPIIDYHCHLPPDQIADNHRFSSLTEAWLQGDHYKWRAMRTDGVAERFITGDASDWEKFEAWARTVPHTLRNPLYHWTHLELRFPFGVEGKLLSPATAREIYERCNAQLARDEFTTQGLLAQYRVLVVCSTDDPVDDLAAHERHRKNGGETQLLPTFRPDKALAAHDLESWNGWVDRLAAAANVDIGSYAALVTALDRRHAFFHENGCRASDHGLDRIFAADYAAGDADKAFAKARRKQPLDATELDQLRSSLLFDLALMNHARGWAQQYHLGAMRNNNTRALRTHGPDTGYDSIGDLPQAGTLARFLDRLDNQDELAKTVLYNLNPADNEVLATMLGNFQDGSVPGKIQFGSAWWFLDQLEGMEKQMNALSNMGLLYRFIGMLTDSRSFLSYSRHEYFRRLLCNMIGNDVERGLVPNEPSLLRDLVERVCFRNAREYFGFHVG
jgi:glucuronate isomerase